MSDIDETRNVGRDHMMKACHMPLPSLETLFYRLEGESFQVHPIEATCSDGCYSEADADPFSLCLSHAGVDLSKT